MTSKLLAQLLYECTEHYRDRGFPESALIHLRWVLITNTRDDQIQLKSAYQSCNKKVKDLLGHFTPCPQQNWTPEVFQTVRESADAVFGFACGYRMKTWAGVDPNTDAEVIANRLPGINNEALAEQARQLHKAHNLDLYLQFEIADAIRDTPVTYTSQRKDQGTKAVLDEFMHHAAKHKTKELKTVVVVAHRQHYDRCRLLLEERARVEKRPIFAIPPPEWYWGYDPLEAQPRAMTQEEYIVNDFASMAGMAPMITHV